MSNCLKSIRKEASKRPLVYEPEMYITTIGSLVICALMFLEEKPSVTEINKKWRSLVKEAKKGTSELPELSDVDFISKVLSAFDLKQPSYFPIAIVRDNFGCLFAPYINNNLLPLREDGVYSRTLQKGKVYPIDFEKEGENK